jgi:integrase
MTKKSMKPELLSLTQLASRLRVDRGTLSRKLADLPHVAGERGARLYPLAEAGHSEATIAELMGHSSPRTTRRYTHGTEAAKRAAVEAARPRTGAMGRPAGVLIMRG